MRVFLIVMEVVSTLPLVKSRYARGKAWMLLAQFSAHASRYTYNFESGPLHVPESGS